MSSLSLMLLALVSLEVAESGYIITSPRVYRTGSIQTVNVDLFGDDALWNITVFLRNTRGKDIISQARKSIRGGSQGTIDIQVPQSVSVHYNQFNNVFLQVSGVAYRRKPFDSQQALTLEQQNDTLFIQTDKPIYKPGQTIRVRVVGVKPDLKPLTGKVEKITIANPTGVRMMQWNSMDLQNGIVSVEMALSKHPVLGNWKIKAQYKGKQIESTLEVSKYVLPKFEVVINPPQYIAMDSKVVSGSICAKYTYGQLVSGTLKAVFELRNKRRHSRWFHRRRQNIKHTTIQKKIQGCYDFSFTSKELGWNRGTGSLKITAVFTEEATGIKQTAKSTETKVQRYRVKLDFIKGTPKYFKPGLPFYGKLQVSSPTGQPIAKENIQISVKNKKGAVLFKKDLLSTPSGVISFKTGNIPLDTKGLVLTAQHNSRSSTTMKISSWFSPSSSFLLLQKLTKPLKVGNTAKIRFQCTLKAYEKIPNFAYNLMCGGKVMAFDEKTNPNIQIKRTPQARVVSDSIQFLVTRPMVPSCRLLLYYVRVDGETVADSMVVDVEGELENQVVVRFNANVRRPGEPVQISMTATPGSTVALAGIDKSVRLLGQAQDIDKAKVMDVLSSNDVGPSGLYKRKQKCRKDDVVDSSKAFYDAGLIYMSDTLIESRPCLPIRPWRPWTPFAMFLQRRVDVPLYSGFFSRRYGGPIGKRRKKVEKRKEKKRKPVVKPKNVKAKPVTIRKNFPETWLWTEETISNGQRNITAKVPDTITSWYLGAFGMSSSTGMGVANPSSLTVFQPFFVSFTLPYSVIRGEQVSIVTTVFNYMDKCATIRIRLTQTDHFQLISPVDQNLCICGNEAKSVKYVITPVKLGRMPLTVTVQNVAPSLCKNPAEEASLGISDAVTRQLLVEPEGVRKEYTYSNYICPQDKDNDGVFSDKLIVSLPKKIVPGSIYATISAIGDLMGPTLNGLEGLLRLPTGCGEQNMVLFAPNIFVMQYLNSTDQLTNDIKVKAVGFLRTGYQRELTYKRKDGSYSAFGNRDKEGSLWLTAFVLRCFSQARQFIFVDDEELKAITKWIENKQLQSGCFKKHGRLLHKELKGGVSNTVTLTAFITISLLESKVSPKSDVIVNALKCVTSQKDSVTDAYSNAIIAYALTLAKHPSRGVFLKRLKNQAIIEGGLMHWEKKEKPKKSKIRPFWEPPYKRSSATNIETTSYALMAMVGDGSDSRTIADAMGVVRWISKQRNALGGFSSTQDTCVALQGLSKYARYVYASGIYMRVDVGYHKDKNFQHSFHINDGNRLVLQRVEVPDNILPNKTIPFDAFGRGCALVQAEVLYNVPDVEETPAFTLTVDVRHCISRHLFTETTEAGEQLCRPLEIKVCAKWIEDDEPSGMAVVDVKMVSGFVPDEESLEKLMSRIDLNMKKFEIEENKVVFYFDEIKDICYSFVVHQTSVVKNTKPASVSVYDYYDTDKSATTMYNITEELCKSKIVPCVWCPKNPDLKALRSTICKKKYVLSIRTSKDGQASLDFGANRQDVNSTILKRTDNIPLKVSPPMLCRCEPLDPRSHALVFLEKKPADQKLRVLDLDDSAMVVGRKGISTSTLANALTKCP